MSISHARSLAAFLLAFLAVSHLSFARETGSTRVSRRHGRSVLSLASIPGTGSFFSGGEDGFVSRHDGGTGDETWQISDLPIRIIAAHPSGDVIACYESDGFTTHRLSVWNWEKKTRVFAKRFRDSITSVSWSARGSWIMVGSTSLEGFTVIDGKSGEARRMFKTPQGLVYLSVTGASENSVMTYGPSGKIRYTDASSGSERAVYDGPADITNAVVHANNRIISGFTGGSVVSIDATKGTVVDSYESGEPVFATMPADPVPVWIERTGPGYSLRAGKAASPRFSPPNGSKITSATGLPGLFALGTDSGLVLTFPRGDYSASQPVPAETRNEAIIPADDIVTTGDTLYILAGGTVYASNDPSVYPARVFGGIQADRMEIVGATFVFWSSISASPLIATSLSGDGRRELYVPGERITSLNHNDGVIAFVEGSSTAIVIRPESEGEPFRYSGAGLQDAVPLTRDSVIVSKSSTSRSPFPLLFINSDTGETVPLPVQGDLCYSLKLSNPERNELRGFVVKGGNPPSTELVTVRVDPVAIASTRTTVHATYKDEDLRATLAVDSKSILTNLGKANLAVIDPSSGRQRPLVRDYALPAKGAILDGFIVSLNYDGSLTWYEKQGKGIAATAVLVGIDEWAQ